MIPTPPQWTRRFVDEPPDALVLYPPGGEAVGAIGYRERIRPLLPLRLLVDKLVAKHSEFRVIDERSEPIITNEGEYGAVVTLSGELAGQPAQRDVGYVFVDDFYAHISGLTTKPDQFTAFTDVVRDLVRHDSHRMTIRRRRFLCSPPPGWTLLERGFMSHWIAPNARDTVLTIWPANPRLPREDASTWVELMLVDERASGVSIDATVGPAPTAIATGLAGFAWELIGRRNGVRIFRDVVVFEDSRFLYPLALESTNPDRRVALRPAFLDTVRSALPIPGAPTSTTTTFDHWVL